MSDINEYISSSSQEPSKSSSNGKVGQPNKFKPYNLDDFEDDAIEFQKDFIPGAKSYYGLMSDDPNYTIYNAVEDLHRDINPIYNLYKEGNTNPTDYVIEAAFLGSPLGRKLLSKFDNKVDDVINYIFDDAYKAKSVKVRNNVSHEPTGLELRLKQASEEKQMLQDLLKEVRAYDKAMNKAEQHTKKLNLLDNKIKDLNQKSNILNKFEQSAGKDYNYFVNDKGDYFIKDDEGIPYRILGDIVEEDRFAGRTPITAHGATYYPRPNLYEMANNRDDTFFKDKVTNHLVERPNTLDPRIAKSVKDKERRIERGELNSLIDTEALPIPYYNNPEDYSSIMSVLKSRKK